MELYALMMIGFAILQCAILIILMICDRATDRLFLLRLVVFCGVITTSITGFFDLMIG